MTSTTVNRGMTRGSHRTSSESKSTCGGRRMFSKSHLFARQDFFRFLDLEIKRARRYQNFFAVMRFELRGEGVKKAKIQAKGLEPLIKLLRGEIRETDVIGQTKKNEIMIILPYCDSSGADIVKIRLNNLVEDFRSGKGEFKIKSGLVCFPMEGTDMAEILTNLGTVNARVRGIGESKSGTVAH